MGLADMSNKRLGLGLGLGLGLHQQQSENSCTETPHMKKHDYPYKCDQKVLYPSLTLGPPPDDDDDDDKEENNQKLLLPTKTESVHNLHAIASSHSHSAASSFSNSSSVKRENNNKDFLGDDLDLEVDNNKVNNPSKHVGLDIDEDGNPRKKLRLTKDQSAVLEDSFKEHSTLNPVWLHIPHILIYCKISGLALEIIPLGLSPLRVLKRLRGEEGPDNFESEMAGYI